MLLVLVFAALGCALPRPAPTPAALNDVIGALVLRGVAVRNAVSGDSGCPEAALHDNAVHLSVSVERSGPLDVYLFHWRRDSDAATAAATFDACVAEFRNSHPGTPVSTVGNEAWRAYGPAWPEELTDALTGALVEVGGR